MGPLGPNRCTSSWRPAEPSGRARAGKSSPSGAAGMARQAQATGDGATAGWSAGGWGGVTRAVGGHRLGHRRGRGTAADRGGPVGVGQVVAARGRADAAADRAGDAIRADGQPGGRSRRAADDRDPVRDRGPVRGGLHPVPGRGSQTRVHHCRVRAGHEGHGDPGAPRRLLRPGPALPGPGHGAAVPAGRARADQRRTGSAGDGRAGPAGPPGGGRRAGRAAATGPGPEGPEDADDA